MKIRLLNILTIIVIVTLIVIRFISQTENGWISCLNYIGLVIAVCGFLFDFSPRHKNSTLADFIKGILIIVIFALIIGACCIFTGVIKLNTLANDEILLITLLISLPLNYYCEVLDKLITKQVKKEHNYGNSK